MHDGNRALSGPDNSVREMVKALEEVFIWIRDCETPEELWDIRQGIFDKLEDYLP